MYASLSQLEFAKVYHKRAISAVSRNVCGEFAPHTGNFEKTVRRCRSMGIDSFDKLGILHYNKTISIR